jgi:ankyrin repeat protein
VGRLVQRLIEQKVDLNARGGESGDALQAACRHCREHIVKMLLAAGVNQDYCGGGWGNAIRSAQEGHHKNRNIMKMLFEAKPDVKDLGNRYHGTIEFCLYWGQIDLIRMFLDAGVDVNKPQMPKYDNCEYMLQAAAAWGKGDDPSRGKIVRMLLEAGANINQVRGHYETALRAACMNNCLDAVQVLLEDEWKVDLHGFGRRTGSTPLDVARYYERHEIKEMLLARGAKYRVNEASPNHLDLCANCAQKLRLSGNILFIVRS